MSHRYKVVITKEPEGGYSVYVPALPGCASQGATTEEAMANIREAIDLYLEDLVAEKEPIPADMTELREVEVTT